uniref:TACC_C domain-containing protein n=1 Tax=Strongyloides papillosus TaxID=174720 RepID=A0A0N5CEY9_STREA
MESSDNMNKTSDSNDELNKTADSLEGNITEDDGSATHSDEELNRTTDSLDANLTEEDIILAPSSQTPAVLLEKRDTGLSKTISFEDLTQDTISADETNNLFNSGIMSESKQDNLSAINKTISTLNDGCVTVTRPKSKSRLNNAAMFMMNSTTQSTMDNSTRLMGLTKSINNPIDDMSNAGGGKKIMGRIDDRYLPRITEELVAKIGNIVSNGNNEDTIKQLVELTKEVSRENFNRLAQEIDVEYNILEQTLENYCKVFEQLKEQCLIKKGPTPSANVRSKAHLKSLIDSIEYTKNQLNSGIMSYNEQAKILENSSANTFNQINDLWHQYEEIKTIEDQFVKYLDAYRKLRLHYKRLILSTRSQSEKAREEQERNLTILKLNIRKIQKDVEEHHNILQNKQDNLKELENILEVYIGKIDGDSTA